MAKTTEEFEEHILDVDVTEEMESSFLEYAYSVIYARALPDARDGLKPVQRRILFSMDDMGVRPEKGHVKCARVVGQVMGVLHPHGDSAIYDALVRMAQPWATPAPAGPESASGRSRASMTRCSLPDRGPWTRIPSRWRRTRR